MRRALPGNGRLAPVLLAVAALLLAGADAAQVNCTGNATGSSSGNCTAGCYPAQNGDCTKCPNGKYKAVATAATCSDCPAGKQSGVGSNAVGECANCSAAEYSAAGGECQNCPAGKISLPGSVVVGDCTNCVAGKYRPNPPAAGSGSCNDCAAGKSSPAGSDAVGDCTNCTAGKYAASGDSVCSNCAAGKSSNAGSVCTNCDAGKFAAAGAACSNCAAGKSSPAASDAVGDCTACAAGKFSVAGAACSNCAAGKTSPAGSDAAADCTTTTTKVPVAKETVIFTATLPYTKAQFDVTDKKTKYKQAVGDAAGVDPKLVSIVSIKANRRAGSIKVETKVGHPDAGGAKKLKNSLTLDNINTELKKQGLEKSTGITDVNESSAGRTGISTGNACATRLRGECLLHCMNQLAQAVTC